MVILELVAMCSCVGLTDLSMLSPNKGMVGLKLTLDKGGGGGQISTPSQSCVTYLYYDPNLNCCYEKMQVDK